MSFERDKYEEIKSVLRRMKVGDLCLLQWEDEIESVMVLSKLNDHGYWDDRTEFRMIATREPHAIWGCSSTPVWLRVRSLARLSIRDLPLYISLPIRASEFDELLKGGLV
jgi:hypothetical protein